jgi:hypothetical protein
MPEVLASQDEMLRRRGTYKEGANLAVVAAAFEKHLREVDAWMDGKPNVKSLKILYHDVLQKSKEVSANLAEFLGMKLNVEAMTAQVDGSLYRNRAK